jgi:hypothetical protein
MPSTSMHDLQHLEAADQDNRQQAVADLLSKVSDFTGKPQERLSGKTDKNDKEANGDERG